MRKSLLPALAAGVLAAAVAAAPAPAEAQDREAYERRGWFEFDRGYRQGQADERRAYRGDRDAVRDAYERGYRQGQMDERRAGLRPGYGYGYGRNYGWGGEERFEREGLFGGLFGEREYEFDD
jgi:hypothetical protein